MNPTLFPHRIAETTEALALFACGYDPEWDEALASELDQTDGSPDLAAITAGVLSAVLDSDTTTAYLRIVN